MARTRAETKLVAIAKRAILSLLRHAGYSLVKLSDVQETLNNADKRQDNPASGGESGVTSAIEQLKKAVVGHDWAQTKAEISRLIASPSADAPMLSSIGKRLFDHYFSLQDKTSRGASEVAHQALALFESALRLSPYRFDDYRCTRTLLFYLGEKVRAYDVMTELMARQRELAAVYGFTGLKRRFISSHVMTNIGVTTHLEIYLKAMDLGLIEKSELVLLMHEHLPANPCLLDYFSKRVRVVPHDETPPDLALMEPFLVDDLHWGVPLSGSAIPFSRAAGEIRASWQRDERPPLLTIDPQHAERGAAKLLELGMPANVWFVALHVRESGKADDVYRDVKIETYGQAIQEIVDRGGWVVRLGDEAMTKLPHQKNVIDYAHSPHRSDWMDIYLIAKSRFVISTGSGPGGVPYAFGVPNLLTNYMPIATIASTPADMVLPKMVASVRDGRVLSFAELLSAPVADCYFQHEFDALAIDPVDNTPEELREAVIEMINRLENHPQDSRQDTELLKRFWEISAASKTATGTRLYSRVPLHFLRAHADQLH